MKVYDTLQSIARSFKVDGFYADHEIGDETVYVYRANESPRVGNEVAAIYYHAKQWFVTGDRALLEKFIPV